MITKKDFVSHKVYGLIWMLVLDIVGKLAGGCQEESLLLHQPQELIRGSAQNWTSLALVGV